ncbi:MAG TPA: ribulose-bisphosphate carboxylase large subunit family protein [Bryobacteraceae bacterium]|nr:ribulose-bisphosphate carboxylase large subunit family protein [Bryobacteraceae bacterium]
MMEPRIRARYRMETPLPAEQAAEVIAGEQSTGTFTRIPGETDELRERHGARVESVTQTGASASEVELSWPLSNMGPSLPNLLATVAGNLWELKQFTALRLLDLELPPPFLDRYCGPQFGVAGTRSLCGVYGRPVIGTIIKPSVGLTPEATAEIVAKLVEGGIDFIKDDELQCDGPHCPFEERLKAVMRVIHDHAARTGKRVMYAANITGELDEMLRRHDAVASYGGTCVMVSIHSIGVPGLAALRRHCAVAIHGHRNGWGLLGRSRDIAVSFVAWQKIWRLAGVDQIHCNGIANKFWEPDESVIASARECLKPMFDVPGKGCEVMPVLASGQTARQAPATYAALGVTDLLFAAGGGIMAHPDGIAAGVRSLHQAWQAAVDNVPLETYAGTHSELRAALDRFQP